MHNNKCNICSRNLLLFIFGIIAVFISFNDSFILTPDESPVKKLLLGRVSIDRSSRLVIVSPGSDPFDWTASSGQDLKLKRVI